MIRTPRTSEKLIINKTAAPKSNEPIITDDFISDEEISNFGLSNDISNFRDIPRGNFTVFDFTGSQITSFEGINRFQNLRKLILKDTLISSFKDACLMKFLTEIDLSNIPVNRRFFVREMALFALGFQLQIINGQPVTQIEHNLSTLNTKTGIELAIRKGHFLTAYPNSDPVNNYTTSHFGFSSSISAKELDESFEQFNTNFNEVSPPESRNIPIDQIVTNMSRTSFAIKLFRSQQDTQQRWFNLENTRYTSADDEIANMRMSIFGLKPSLTKSVKLSHLATAHKNNEALIKSLEQEIAHQKMLIEQIKSCLHLSTEMNFGIHFKINDSKNEKVHFTDDELNNLQKEIDELTEQVKVQQIENEKLKNELKIQNISADNENQNQQLQIETNQSKETLNSLLFSNEKKQDEIGKLRIELEVLNDEELELEKQYELIENEVKEMNIQKNEIDERIEKKIAEFNERIKVFTKT